jgi:hypothetical protein
MTSWIAASLEVRKDNAFWSWSSRLPEWRTVGELVNSTSNFRDKRICSKKVSLSSRKIMTKDIILVSGAAPDARTNSLGRGDTVEYEWLRDYI